MRINSKGQAALIGWIFITVLGLMIYFIGPAQMIGDAARAGVTQNNITGFEGMFYSNINLIIAAFYLLIMFMAGRFLFS
jgi:hypothetical protein